MLYTYIYLYKYIHTIVELYWRKTTTNIKQPQNLFMVLFVSSSDELQPREHNDVHSLGEHSCKAAAEHGQ